jgi:hypothetical protein
LQLCDNQRQQLGNAQRDLSIAKGTEEVDESAMGRESQAPEKIDGVRRNFD